MSHAARHAIAVTARVRRALEETASSLAGARLDGLLSAEAALEEALACLPDLQLTGMDERPQLRVEIDMTRAALRRCHRLGVSLSDVVTMSLDAQSPPVGYRPAAEAASALSGRGFSARA